MERTSESLLSFIHFSFKSITTFFCRYRTDIHLELQKLKKNAQLNISTFGLNRVLVLVSFTWLLCKRRQLSPVPYDNWVTIGSDNVYDNYRIVR